MKTGTYYNLKCLYEYYQLRLPPTAPPPLECMEDDRLTGVQYGFLSLVSLSF